MNRNGSDSKVARSLAAAEDARAVPIHEQGKEDLGRVGLTSTRAEARIEMAKIKLGDQINAV